MLAHLRSARDICVFLNLSNNLLKDGDEKAEEGKDESKKKPDVNHLDVGCLGHSKMRSEKRLDQPTLGRLTEMA